MKNLRGEKGSITLFVLVSCMFFIVSVVEIQAYLNNKKVSIDKEYRQIKSSYETDVNNMESVYNTLSSIANIDDISITFEKNQNEDIIAIVDTTNFDIKTIKYGWYYSSTEVENTPNILPEEYTFIEATKTLNKITINKPSSTNTGFYYLCIVIKDDYGNEKFEWLYEPYEIK